MVACKLALPIPRRKLAAIIAFGAGTQVVALSFELMAESVEKGAIGFVLAGQLSGTLVFILLDTMLDRAHVPGSLRQRRPLGGAGDERRLSRRARPEIGAHFGLHYSTVSRIARGVDRQVSSRSKT
ncbi:hypothetical protein RM530_02820 [Algiphilus sp. W345]|uniref:Uncharacterized protein n=1 Tax=Banduia mediterranea TaxID=3075609 RepID=A0ABU2WEM2_9GAMM|nr:hypothetical protein [Algiphilus sp. W345]MDT0496301.1 hypothetical protein [Algiphilus sp. W345]